MVSGEPDFTARSKAFIDLMYIKHVLLKDPYVAACVPSSIENPALAYEVSTDRFKVKIEDATGVTLTADISDKWARQLGQVDLARVLGSALSHSNPVIVRLTNGGSFLDPTQIRTLLTTDSISIYGSQTQKLLQRASTFDAIVQLRHNGVEVDPTAIRALTSADAVTAYGSLDKLQQRAVSKDLLVQLMVSGAEIDPRAIRVLTSSDVVDVFDRAARLLGIVYGSQNQQVKQTATNFNLAVELLTGATAYDARSIRLLTSSDVVDVVDKATRLLGVIYGSQGQQLKQTPTNYNAQVELATGATLYDARSIRALTASDIVTAQQATRTSLKAQTEREDLISLGGVASPSAAGVQIVAPSGSLKVKVYDAGYEALAAGLHYFYFGTSTSVTTRRFCTRSTTGPILKTFVQPRVSDAADGLYIYSAVAETNMPYDVGYTLEA